MNRQRALIVDDEPDIRELLEITLGRMKLDTRSARNVKEAREWLAREPFDLCLTDMRLPDGTGLDLVQHIQQRHPQVPVAMITASSIMLSIAGPGGFGVHVFYIYLAVGYGASMLSWMNDSGFWVIGRLGGLTEGETLRSWTMLLSLISVLGLIQALVAARLWPNLWF